MAQAHNNNGEVKEPVTVNSLRGFEKTSLSKFLTPKEAEAATDDTGDAGTVAKGVESNVPEGKPDQVQQTGESDTTDSNTDTDKSGDADQVFDVKGQKVPLKDLLNSFETREEISRRFNEIGKREKKLKDDAERISKAFEELAYIDEKFVEMNEEIRKGNPLNALTIAMTMANAGKDSTNPDVIDLIKQAQAISENFASMDEDQQKVFIEKQEIERREKALARKEANEKKRAEELELRNFYNRVLDEHKVTDEELDASFEDIQKLPKYKEQLEKKETHKEKIEYCLAWTLGKRYNKMIGEAIESVDPKLAKDTNFRLALIEDLDPNCTKDDVVKIVTDYLQQNSKEDSAKVESAASTQSVETKPSTTSDRAPTEKTTAEKQTAPITDFKQIIAKYSAR